LEQGIGVYFFESPMGAFLRARHVKTGLSAPIPQNCSAILAGFPLQSLARKKGPVQNRRITTHNGAPGEEFRGAPVSSTGPFLFLE
jgi:hypothetical protein